MLADKATTPTAVLLFPIVLAFKQVEPTAVLKVPVVLALKAINPKPELLLFVLAFKALVPKAAWRRSTF